MAKSIERILDVGDSYSLKKESIFDRNYRGKSTGTWQRCRPIRIHQNQRKKRKNLLFPLLPFSLSLSLSHSSFDFAPISVECRRRLIGRRAASFVQSKRSVRRSGQYLTAAMKRPRLPSRQPSHLFAVALMPFSPLCVCVCVCVERVPSFYLVFVDFFLSIGRERRPFEEPLPGTTRPAGRYQR